MSEAGERIALVFVQTLMQPKSQGDAPPKEAAINDARFQPRALEDWRRIHGTSDPGPDDWERWWKIAQGNNGNPIYGGGVGTNPYGNY